MFKKLSFILVSVLVFGLFAVAAPALAVDAPNWELQAPTGIDFTCGGNYPHTLDSISQDVNGNLTGTGHYNPNPGYTWNLVGQITGDNISFTITYTGIAYGTVYNSVGTIAGDGSISGSTDGNCTAFVMGVDSATEIQVEEPFVRSAQITSPTDGQQVWGTVNFTAVLNDKDGNDNVQWAVRQGTCAAGVGAVFGNVDGYSNSYNWDNYNFSATADVTGWAEGDYCFVFNPTESAGDTPIRLTRNFTVMEPVVVFPVPTTKNECKKGGWMELYDHEGNGFKNQGDCVSYVATGGRNLGALAVI